MRYFKYVRELAFDADPDYCYLKCCFLDYYKEQKYVPFNELKYDWITQKEKVIAEKIRLEEEEKEKALMRNMKGKKNQKDSKNKRQE